ncbi:PH domain-containing protein [Mucilaginibacter sp. FT3.2]|uniref:PH domain-containing protein n=1 Tax=Mucilaginibacter sp. FT3.2 TaxID=2723090 RepID=UPI0016199902|nr:PH domain-containing protein [Mucilaginibacter sp. FT3.2]MBB6234290.1 putative membrane protein YdbT with pleckstrin-like domain [Mucilaginibacter sp. FT3.2]
MDFDKIKEKPGFILRPSAIYALLHILPLLCLSVVFLMVSLWLWPVFIWVSFVLILLACYRFLYIRNIRYLINQEVIQVSTGLFSTRLDSLEMLRVKDYVVLQPLILRVFKLMNLTLKTPHPENKRITFTGIPVSDIIDTIRDHVQKARLDIKIARGN